MLYPSGTFFDRIVLPDGLIKNTCVLYYRTLFKYSQSDWIFLDRGPLIFPGLVHKSKL